MRCRASEQEKVRGCRSEMTREPAIVDTPSSTDSVQAMRTLEWNVVENLLGELQLKKVVQSKVRQKYKI